MLTNALLFVEYTFHNFSSQNIYVKENLLKFIPKIEAACWRYVISRLFLDPTSFPLVRQTDCWYLNSRRFKCAQNEDHHTNAWLYSIVGMCS